MTYIIAEPCIDIKDLSCVDVCPVDCIHEFERILIIDPEECIDCFAPTERLLTTQGLQSFEELEGQSCGVLTDDGFRERFVRQLRDPMIRSFWETQWPGRGERERDTSIKAVLNKLGAFVTYDSIRAVVGQGTSTIRPRDVMDRGEVLLVDLSGVGGDNATLFGAMLASR